MPQKKNPAVSPARAKAPWAEPEHLWQELRAAGPAWLLIRVIAAPRPPFSPSALQPALPADGWRCLGSGPAWELPSPGQERVNVPEADGCRPPGWGHSCCAAQPQPPVSWGVPGHGAGQLRAAM